MHASLARHETQLTRTWQDNVKPEPTEGSASGLQFKTPKVEGVKKVKRERVAAEVVDLTNRARSPIRVPVKGEVIDLSDD